MLKTSSLEPVIWYFSQHFPASSPGSPSLTDTQRYQSASPRKINMLSAKAQTNGWVWPPTAPSGLYSLLFSYGEGSGQLQLVGVPCTMGRTERWEILSHYAPAMCCEVADSPPTPTPVAWQRDITGCVCIWQGSSLFSLSPVFRILAAL